MSENAIVQLEEHLNECPNCVDFFEAKKTYLKRLSELDAAPAPTHAVIEVLEAEVGEEASEEPSPQAKSLIEAILKHKTHLDKVVKPAGSAIDTNDSPKPSRDLTAYYKPTMYLVGLALTLVLMGIFMKDPTRFLGDKVGEGTNSNQAPATTPTTTPTTPPATTPATTAATTPTKAAAETPAKPNPTTTEGAATQKPAPENAATTAASTATPNNETATKSPEKPATKPQIRTIHKTASTAPATSRSTHRRASTRSKTKPVRRTTAKARVKSAAKAPRRAVRTPARRPSGIRVYEG